MHKENKDQQTQQNRLSLPPEILGQPDELSDVWRELLGARVSEKPLPVSPNEGSIPILEVDPWSTLLQANGVEVVDIQQVHLQISEQEVEQILQVMHENTDTQNNAPANDGRDTKPTQSQ